MDDFDDDEEFDVYAKYGLGFELSWLANTPSRCYSETYNRFIENGFVGILTKEEAVERYRIQTGKDPQTVTEWPVIDAIAEERARMAKEFGVPEEVLNKRFPYEPALKYQY